MFRPPILQPYTSALEPNPNPNIYPGLAHGVCYAPTSESGMSLNIATWAHPAVGLTFQGIAYSVYAAAIWPAVVYVVKPNQVPNLTVPLPKS